VDSHCRYGSPNIHQDLLEKDLECCVNTVARRMMQFFRYSRRFDPDGFVPGRDWAPQAAQTHFVPHVFSAVQVRALLNEAQRLRCDLRARPVIRILILILYCMGLRLGEALQLEIGDVDMGGRLFLIRHS